MPCAAHGLATAPDGRCVVCRREERDRNARRHRTLGAIFLVATTLLCGAAVGARLLRREVAATAAPGALADERVPSVDRSPDTLIPTFDIDGKMLRSGFDSSAIASTLAASVERRLGVTGIRVRTAER
jgi:hypothetical protein